MRVTAAAALAEIFTGRLSFDLPDDTPSSFFDGEDDEEEEGSFGAMGVVWDATDQYNREQLLIV